MHSGFISTQQHHQRNSTNHVDIGFASVSELAQEIAQEFHDTIDTYRYDLEDELAEKIKDYGCAVSINPDLFTKFGVTAVPAFVLVNKGSIKGVSGNISLDYVMQHLTGKAID